MVLETGHVGVFKMLQAVLALSRERARSRELDIQLLCPSDIGAVVVDERRLKQALLNLISNAIKFTPPGGAVRIEAVRRESELLLTVADTGIGRALSNQTPIPEKLEHSTPRSGACPGLSLVRKLIELHGGTIAVDSPTGRGTTVTCRLPTTLPALAGLLAPSTQIEDRAAA
jgi:signal transduction histidine kinase